MCFGDCIFCFARLGLLYCDFYLYRIQPPKIVNKMIQITVNYLLKSLIIWLKYFKYRFTFTWPPSQSALGKITVKIQSFYLKTCLWPHWTLCAPQESIYLFLASLLFLKFAIASNHQYPQATYISTFFPWYHFLSPFLHFLLTFLVPSDLKIPCFNFQYPTFQLSPKSSWMSTGSSTSGVHNWTHHLSFDSAPLHHQALPNLMSPLSIQSPKSGNAFPSFFPL